MMYEFDVAIIGAGVIGLAVAREVSARGKSVIVLEKNDSFGRETSSRNSEVIHGGMYYPTSSLKTKLCVEGRGLLYECCERNRIPFKKTGKLIVATEREEIPALDSIFSLGKNNGVAGLKKISSEEIHSLEPCVSGVEGIYSSETGIIDSHKLMQFYLSAALDKGAVVSYNSEMTAISRARDGYAVSVVNGNDLVEVDASVVINCAGLDSDTIAGMIGIDVGRSGYILHYCKGQYFRVSSIKSKKISRLIYPVPKPKSGGLGVHATPDLSGGLRLGPDDEYLNDRHKDYSVDSARQKVFYESAKKFLPFIDEADLSGDTSGIRPKLQEEGGCFRDFVIKEESDKGLPGFINLIGIESPGLTASPAIAVYVGNLVRAN